MSCPQLQTGDLLRSCQQEGCHYVAHTLRHPRHSTTITTNHSRTNDDHNNNSTSNNNKHTNNHTYNDNDIHKQRQSSREQTSPSPPQTRAPPAITTPPTTTTPLHQPKQQVPPEWQSSAFSQHSASWGCAYLAAPAIIAWAGDSADAILTVATVTMIISAAIVEITFVDTRPEGSRTQRMSRVVSDYLLEGASNLAEVAIEGARDLAEVGVPCMSVSGVCSYPLCVLCLRLPVSVSVPVCFWVWVRAWVYQGRIFTWVWVYRVLALMCEDWCMSLSLSLGIRVPGCVNDFTRVYVRVCLNAAPASAGLLYQV